MGDIVNLRRFKKSKSREDDARLAEANRRKFGQTKAEKLERAAQENLDARKLDGHKLDE
jgi:hypothetical protein